MNIPNDLQLLIDENRWHLISSYKWLSEDFITKHAYNLNWNEICRYQVLSEAFIEKHADKICWSWISKYQILSETFIDKYADKLDWEYISRHQLLSEAFIEKHAKKVYWEGISRYQVLSEEFIEKYHTNLNWLDISRYHKLSDEFIERFSDRLNWHHMSIHQIFSKNIMKKFKDRIDVDLQKLAHAKKSLATKRAEMEEYAKKWNLKFDGKFLYAFRNHDQWGRGDFNPTRRYEKGKTYRDWHCDMDTNHDNSFGLGIWPVGNTPVKVAVKDWGCAVYYNGMLFRKGRVFAFTVL